MTKKEGSNALILAFPPSCLTSYTVKVPFEIPDNMLELNDEEFNANLLLDYDDDPYFKLLHTLSFIEEFSLPENLKFVECSVEDYANHINACYEEEYISAEELESYKYKTVYKYN